MRTGPVSWIVALCVAWVVIVGPAAGDDQDAGADVEWSSYAGPAVSPSGSGKTAESLELGPSSYLASASPSTFGSFDPQDHSLTLRWRDDGGAGGAQDDEDTDETELAKQTQNPISDLISLPFQNNTNFGMGDRDRVANVLNIQPVIPVNLNDRWDLITRTILPVIYSPAMMDGQSDEFGIGDLQFTGWLSPKGEGSFVWGVGPVLRFPTASDDSLGSEKWSAGPSFVGLTMQGPWVVGGLVQNVWSYAGDSDRSHVNEFLIQPFINYNLEDGWYLVTAPIITANWNRDSSDQWLIPVGGGAGKVFKIGKQPVNVQLQAFYSAAKPNEGPDWSVRFQFQFLFPKKKGGA